MSPPPPLDAIVLAGGLGTRLRAVLPDRQKVTADVGGEPFLARLIRRLAEAGVTRLVLAAGHRAEDVTALAQAHADPRMQILVSVEPVPMGTGGAARLAFALTETDPVLVMNGDSYSDIDLAAFRAFHATHAAGVSLALVTAAERARFGAVEIDPTGAVTSFREKTAAEGIPGGINAGLYLFSRAALSKLPPHQPLSLERDVFPGMIGAGLYGIRFDSKFIDIGTPESLRAADRFFGVEDLTGDH